MLKVSIACLSLILCAACTGTPKPAPGVLVQIKPVKERIPAALKRRCEDEADAAKMADVGDIDAARIENADKLRRCRLRMDKIIAWDDEAG